MDTVPKYLRCRRPFRKQAVSKLATLQMPTTGEPGTAGVCYADLVEDIIGRTPIRVTCTAQRTVTITVPIAV